VNPSPTPTRRYTLLRRLAIGGMGELLLARASGAGGVEKLVAIKRIRSEYASDPAFVSMFLNEARLAATLDHPNVVRTYDLVDEGGSFFMVMEYLHGESLGRLLNAHATAGTRLALGHVITIALGIAAGLHCAHERRAVDGRPLDIVHRDLSPGNVFITYEGGVKLLDFGIAKATSRTSITMGPTRKGKVAYMSPEQCVGAEVDRRSDLFALGVVLWELSCGRRLFRGDNEFAIMNQITTVDAPSPRQFAPELPEEFAQILLRALHRDPAARFQTAMALHDALEAFASSAGLLPSATALGRHLCECCGEREAPSVEPTDEFADRSGHTLVVPATPATPTATPLYRRLGVVFALATGAIAGAAGVALSSSHASPGAAIDTTTVDDTTVDDATPTAITAPAASPSLPTIASPTIASPTIASPPAPALAEVTSSPKDAPRRRPARTRRSPPAAATPSKPEKVVRGVDGLLPGG
jgi:serine/threonine protein kinase